MVKSILVMLAATLVVSTTQAQTLVGYWDFNSTLTRSAGSSGTLTAGLDSLGLSYVSSGTGTTVNLQSGFSAGESLAFVNLISVTEVGRVTVNGLNFTGLFTPTFSFAAKSTPAFQIGDVFRLEYDSGSGWITAASFQPPTTSYELVSHTFAPGLLDNVANAQIRITFSTIVAVADVFEVDNLTIAAVPEPSTIALLGLCGLALFLKSRKQA